MNLRESFRAYFGCDSTASYRAPARINLIGEHLDYNGGLVLPAAISLYITALVSVRNDSKIKVYSLNTKTGFEVDLKEIRKDSKYSWANYVFGVFSILLDEGYTIPNGLNILIDSEIPLGSGLSSSAALLDLITYLTSETFSLGISLKEVAKLAQRVENDYLGLKSGIMDEAAIALGKKNHCLLLNCQEYEYEQIPLDLGDYTFVVLKTNVPRSLVSSKYNVRVEECQKGLELIKKQMNINNLCEIGVLNLERVRDLISDELIYRRVKHVISEQHRVCLFVEALKKKDIVSLGKILNESHLSLKDDYEVSGPYLDAIQIAAIHAGAIGARMTGAGFGGCAIALIKKDSFTKFREEVLNEYFNLTELHADVLEVDIVDGPQHL